MLFVKANDCLQSPGRSCDISIFNLAKQFCHFDFVKNWAVSSALGLLAAPGFLCGQPPVDCAAPIESTTRDTGDT